MAGPLANPKHELFAQLIASGVENALAWQECGYPRDPQLRNRPHIKRRIGELVRKVTAKLELTQGRVLAEMALLAFYNAADYGTVNEDGSYTVNLADLDREQFAAITEIQSETKYDKEGNPTVTTKVKFADKKAALQDLGRHFGTWVDRTETGQPGDFAALDSLEDIERKIRVEMGDQEADVFLALVNRPPDSTSH